MSAATLRIELLDSRLRLASSPSTHTPIAQVAITAPECNNPGMVSPSRSTCGTYEVSNAPPTRLMPGLPVRKEIGENGKRNVFRVHDSEVVGSGHVVLKPSRGFRIGVIFVLVHIYRREPCELSAQCF